MRKLLGAIVLMATVASCRASDLNVDNPNVASAAGASADPTALQLLLTGLFVDQRGTRTGFISSNCRIGRECYSFSPQEGRNTTHYLIGISVGGVQKLDPTGFATGNWGGNFGTLRDIYNFKKTVATSTQSDAVKAGLTGIAQTFEALMQLELIQTHDSLGTITAINDDPGALAPFVSRDSAYKFILNTFDAAIANLGKGSFTGFILPPGFAAPFNTPAGFAQFANALKARAAANYATYEGGTAAWQTALAALGASFINAAAATRAAFDVGVNDTYGVAPDSPNGLNSSTNTDLYAHMSFQKDVQFKANGKPDDRYTTKIRGCADCTVTTALPSRQGPVTADGPTSASSTLGFSIWTAQTSPVPIIRNEELILLRAEAKLGTGDKTGAIADLNQVRVNSGGLPTSTLTAASSTDQIVDAILYEKRYSLMMEGQRWIDVRRYKRLSQLPLDVASGPNKNFVAPVYPIPQGECLVRAAKTGDLIGPNGLNNCAP